jgi:hypothetical protein
VGTNEHGELVIDPDNIDIFTHSLCSNQAARHEIIFFSFLDQ